MTAITVIADHIAHGERASPWGCPIALAVGDGYGPDEVEVTANAVFMTIAEEFYSADLPPEAARFVETFDGGDPVDPFTFDVEWNPPLPGGAS